jgi:outer membrane protein
MKRGAAQKTRQRVGKNCPMLCLIVVAAVLAASMSAAQAANLAAVYAMARANDTQYAAAVQTAAAGREKSVQARALMLPTVGLTGNARHNNDLSSAYDGSAKYQSGNVTFSASQPLLRRANTVSYEQGELQAQLADKQLKLAEEDLLARVSRGYFEVLQAQDALATVGAQKEAFGQQTAQTKRSVEVGLAPITDFNEAQSRYDLTMAQEIAARNDLELKRRKLEKVIGGELPRLATLDPSTNIDVLPEAQLQSLVGAAAQSATQVAIGTTSEQIARLEVTKQDAGHFPTVDLVASASRNRNANYGALGGQQTRNASIGIDFSVPLYQGGAISSRAREALANLGRTESELENARRQATLDARQGLLGVQSGIALNKALRQAVASGETQVRSTRRGLEVGVRTRVDVLNAEQQLYTTLRDLSAARYQTLISGLQLKAAAGALTEQDLRALDALLKE